jgi:hypothetical protein
VIFAKNKMTKDGKSACGKDWQGLEKENKKSEKSC